MAGISGQIKDRYGQPISGTTVDLHVFDSSDLSTRILQVTTDSNGGYTAVIDDPPSSKAVVMAVTASYDGDTDLAGAFYQTYDGSITFVDHKVSNLKYTTSVNGINSTTNSDGVLLCANDGSEETVSFYLGDVLLGSVTFTEAPKVVTPVDLVLGLGAEYDPDNVAVHNMVRFIRSCGIANPDAPSHSSFPKNLETMPVSDDVHTELTGVSSIDFTQSYTDFSNDTTVQSVMGLFGGVVMPPREILPMSSALKLKFIQNLYYNKEGVEGTYGSTITAVPYNGGLYSIPDSEITLTELFTGDVDLPNWIADNAPKEFIFSQKSDSSSTVYVCSVDNPNAGGNDYVDVFDFSVGFTINPSEMVTHGDFIYCANGSELKAIHAQNVYSSHQIDLGIDNSIFTGTINSIAILPTDKSILAVADGDTLRILSTSDWTEDTNSPGALAGAINSLAFSNDGTILYVGLAASPYFQAYNVSDWTLVSGTPTPAAAVKFVAVSSDDAVVALGPDVDTGLEVYNVSDWSAVSTPSVTGNPLDGDFSSDGNYFARSSTVGMEVMNVSDWTLVSGANPYGSDVNLPCIKFNDASTKLYAGGSGNAKLINVSDWTSSSVYSDSAGDSVSMVFVTMDTLPLGNTDLNTKSWSDEEYVLPA